MTGADLLVKLLEEQGVTVVFGYPGGAILPFYDALYKSKKIKHYLMRHEQGAVHAATGYARVTGKVGVCIATSGPGATNLVTGIADAKSDSVPVLAITGQVAVPAIGSDAFQEADIFGISVPITKYNALIREPNELAEKFFEAWDVMTFRRPGPALLDLPKDVQNAEIPKEFWSRPAEQTLPARFYETLQPTGQLDELAEAINNAKRPVFYVGGGAVIGRCENELMELVDKTQALVTNTLMGLSSFPGTHELSMGMLGMHGTAYANKLCTECDLIVSMGARFDDRVAGANANDFVKQAKKAHIDIDPSEINKRANVDIAVNGDLKDVLRELLKRVKSFDELDEDIKKSKKDWIARLFQLKEAHPLGGDYGGVNSPLVYQKVYELTKGEAIVATDVGQHQMFAAQYYLFDKPQSWLTSGGLGTMGYGFPAAIGAKLAFPERTVICVTGDGSFQMNLQEMATCSAFGIGVKILLFNNNTLGMVRQWQNLFFEERYSESTLDYNPDFGKLAEAYHFQFGQVNERGELDAELERFLADDKPALLEIKIPQNEKVFPMIPAGKQLEDMIIGIDPDGKLVQ